MRYPGGKFKLRAEITGKLVEILAGHDLEYREPFFGGGSIGLEFLKNNHPVRKVWLNDKDVALCCFWAAVMLYPEDLKAKIREFKPTAAAFYDFRDELLVSRIIPHEKEPVLHYGFLKLAIHQISYSGLGVRSGGPLGGKTQDSAYKVDCRWSVKHLCKDVDVFHERLAAREVKISCGDFADLIQCGKSALLYLDPPYYLKGGDLYQHSFTEEDHQRLAKMLRETKHYWVLSYDDCPAVRELYAWANCEAIGVNYTIRTARRKGELIIVSPSCSQW